MSRFICSLIAFLVWGTTFAAMMTVSVNYRNIKITCSTISVDPSGGGNFKTIQSAINYVPQFSRHWICIRVKQGIYRERVYIPAERPFIYLEGEGQTKTHVVSDGHDPFDATATFTTRAENIVVKGISFNNSYNSIGSHNSIAPAAAAKIEGDKSAFYDCGFFGLQDTLWDSNGRHYFKRCTIEGAADFIFGSGQSIYEKCLISVVAATLNGAAGYITAQGREQAGEKSGFVFKQCNVFGNGKTFLGRAWRKYARVIFYQTSMSDIIVPLGWDAWGLLMFEEIDCHGVGANTSGRVRWANKRLNNRYLQRLIDISYINYGGWILPEFINN
ncbi:Pectin lyase-like superfamily protein [Perilla frutescens var. frutescens]|nr:Pectin lyase-like superfamily protein [Perilla frutescens var. frutescens]